MASTQEKCFLLTAAFEGGGYSTLSGSFDGMGISFGFLQWNLGCGTLQPLLKAMFNAGPKTFERCCTVEVAGKGVTDLSRDLLAVCDKPKTEAVAWAVARQDAGHRLLPHWTKAFKNLAAEPGFQKVQRQFAAPYWNRAVAYMSKFGFKSERALALLFDICVQMGSITGASQARYDGAVAGGMSEEAKLDALARAVGPQAGRWQADVLSRKRTISLGKGIVHGRSYNLEVDYDITLRPVVG